MGDEKQIDKGIVMNSVVHQMMTNGKETGKIEISFDKLAVRLDLNAREICSIIEEMRYEVVYNPTKNSFKIWKREKFYDGLQYRDSLYRYLEELKEKYIEDFDMKLLDLSDLKLDPDEIAEMIEEAGYRWHFVSPKKLWIF